MPATYKAAVVKEAKGDIEIVEREKVPPKGKQVLIRVEACGICHSDLFVKDGLFPGIEYPRTPGHEVIGVIEQVGDEVRDERAKPGTRVGVGWHGMHCYECDSCLRGDFITCAKHQVTGINFDGGWAEYLYCPDTSSLVYDVPDLLSSEKASVLLCAGVTTYNALRNCSHDLKPGDSVAVLSVGGLGHLAVQYAVASGYHTIAISSKSSQEKKEFATKQLGAAAYVGLDEDNCIQKIKDHSTPQGKGVKAILATSPNSDTISKVVDALSVNGVLVVLGATPEPMQISPFQLIMKRARVLGHPSGSPIDSTDTMQFTAQQHIEPHIETYPLEKAAEAYNRMVSGQARYRVVLVPSHSKS